MCPPLPLGSHLRYEYSHVYRPKEGAFVSPQQEVQKLGTYHSQSDCSAAPSGSAGTAVLIRPEGSDEGFCLDGVQYKVGDGLFLKSDAFSVSDISS
jgi:hypothetical protein